jgi:hypothetical protein
MDIKTGINYKKAGNLELIRERDGKHFLAMGKVEFIGGLAITQKTTNLPDGNSDFDLEYSTGKDGQIAVNLSSFVPSLYSALTGAEYAAGTNGTIRKIEEVVIPDDGEVTLKDTPSGDLTVVDGDNVDFTLGETTPTAGEYTFATDTVTFAVEDAGKLVYIAYDVEAPKTQGMSLEASNNADVFKVVVTGEAILAENEGITVHDQLTIDRATVTGEVKMPDRSKEPKGWNFTLKLQAPRAGRKAVDYKYVV